MLVAISTAILLPLVLSLLAHVSPITAVPSPPSWKPFPRRTTSSGDRLSPAHLLKPRNEEFQVQVYPGFPHLLGPPRLLAWMDKKADPCNDFFQYACGGFIEKFKNTDDGDVLSLMQISNELLVEEVLNIPISHLAQSESEGKLLSKLHNYYDTCLDSDSIDSRGISPLLPLIKAFADSCDEDSNDLPRLLGITHGAAVYSLFRVVFTKIEGQSAEHLRLELFPAPAYDVSASVIAEVLLALCETKALPNLGQKEIEDMAVAIYEAEQDLLLFVDDSNKVMVNRESTDEQFMTLDQFNSYTGMNWNRYLAEVDLEGVELIHIWGNPHKFVGLLKEWGKVDLEFLKYFFAWRASTTHFNKLAKKYYNYWASYIYPKTLQSQYLEVSDTEYEFQQNCVTEVGVRLNYLSGWLYANFAFNATQRKEATVMIDDLFSATERTIKDLNWLDTPTREAALKKLHHMGRVIGYPDWFFDVSIMERYYAPIDFRHGHYFENAVAAQVFSDLYPSILELRTQLDPTHSLLPVKDPSRPFTPTNYIYGYPWLLNAFHLTDMNQIQINTGILQRPLFSHSNPSSMNYGSLGTIIGHEITHAFDSTGYKVDFEGSEKPWWTPTANASFQLGARCFEKQYSKLDVEVNNSTRLVDGVQTLPENIADNGGVDLASEAWKRRMARERGEEAYRDAMGEEKAEGCGGLTQEQVFFVAFAQTWCTVPYDDQVDWLLKNDVHAPNPVRVRGVLQNNRDFERVFSCKAGDRYVALGGDNGRCYLY
ncbi:hypothetical protein BJ742DRAFT_547277 [Cladochytrium replicatum]|nr:hypothetical protein BJ742DRAFT_547277 [Cladochytrium replicatum]